MNQVVDRTDIKMNLLKILLALAVMGVAVWFTQTELFIDKQREFNQSLMSAIRELKREASLKTMITISFFSVLYGIIHALGPGHGKLIILNFLLNNSNNYKKAIKTSFFTTLTHVGVAVAIAFLFKYVFTTIRYFQRIAILGNFKTVSAVIIALIGVLIIVYPLIKKWIPIKDKLLTENTAITGMLAGAVPCPLSMTIMLVSISYSIEYIGIALVASIAFGILVFLSVFSLVFIYFRKNSSILLKVAKLKGPIDFRYIQGLLYVIIGIILFS